VSRRTRHLLVACVAALATAGCAVDRHEVAYTDYFDAKAQDAIKREWVPEWLPEVVTDIREVHAGDTRKTLLRAQLPQGASLPDECAPVDVPPTPSLDAAWFPADVIQLGEVSVCDDDSYVVVADGVLYRWTVGPQRPDDPSPTSLPSED
jgi:hypothetical protein